MMSNAMSGVGCCGGVNGYGLEVPSLGPVKPACASTPFQPGVGGVGFIDLGSVGNFALDLAGKVGQDVLQKQIGQLTNDLTNRLNGGIERLIPGSPSTQSPGPTPPPPPPPAIEQTPPPPPPAPPAQQRQEFDTIALEDDSPSRTTKKVSALDTSKALKTGLIVAGGVAVLGVLAFALTRKR